MATSSLASLRDIHLPPAPAAWPPAPGWWLAGLLLLLLAGLWLLYRGWHRRQLRAALRELKLLAAEAEKTGAAVRTAGGISRLLRRYACWRYPEAGAHALTGAAWLQFLDTRGGDGQFEHGAGAALASLPYQPAAAADVTALLALARNWLRRNAP